MLLFAMAVIPNLAVCIYIFYNDRYNREPPLNLIFSFLLGMIIIVPTMTVEVAVNKYFSKNVLSIIAGAYLGVALVEEISKFLVLRYYCFTRKSFDEPLDGIVYSIMVGMGFATVENVFYVYEYGFSTALVRMITSVPAHTTFAIIMGYYIGTARFDWVNRHSLFLKGILGAAFAHGTYDVFLFLNQNDWLKQYISELLLFIGAIVSLFIAIHLSRRLIRIHQSTSQQLFKATPSLNIRNASVQDIDLIRDLSLQVWPQTYASILSKQQIEYMMQLLYSKEAILKQMKEKHQFLIIYNSGIPIGFASYSEVEAHIYKLHKIYVLPIHQGRGVGRFIIRYIINCILPQDATALRLNVNRSNKAKDFYQQLGFQIIREEDIPIGNGFYMNDYVMELNLQNNQIPPT